MTTTTPQSSSRRGRTQSAYVRLCSIFSIVLFAFVVNPPSHAQVSGITVPNGFNVTRLASGLGGIGYPTGLQDLEVGRGAFGAFLYYIDSGTIYRLDLSNNSSSVFASVPNALFMRFAFNGDLFVSTSVGTIIRVKPDKTTSTFATLGSSMEGLAYSSNPAYGDRLFVSEWVSGAPGRISAIDANGAVTRIVPSGVGVETTGLEFCNFATDLPLLYTIDQPGTIFQIASNNTVSLLAGRDLNIALQSGETLACGSATTAFGKYLYIAEQGSQPSGRILRVAPDGSVSVFASGFQGFNLDGVTGLKFSPDGETLYVTDDAGRSIYSIQTANSKDSDGDGLLDDWEDHGFDYNNDGFPDVDLPGKGASKFHKDIFVHVDWLGHAVLRGEHSHRPNTEALQKVVKAFANAPVSNPDGIMGIKLHVEYGKQIIEDNNNTVLGSITMTNGVCQYSWDKFNEIKNSGNFPPEMRTIYHYVIFAHYLPTITCNGKRPSGISRPPNEEASDFIIALNDWESILKAFPLVVENARAGTFMHELGHNLGLDEGGLRVDDQGKIVPDNRPYKPNHLSVMNYSFMTRGLIKKGLFGVFWEGNMDYSRFDSDALPNLSEQSLDETSGLSAGNTVKEYGTKYFCKGNTKATVINGLQQSVDWNCNGFLNDTHVVRDINQSNAIDAIPFSSVNEWSNLTYKGGAIGGYGISINPPIFTVITSGDISFEDDSSIGPYNPEPISVNLPLVVR